MKYKREHKYETALYEEQLYKEVVYDTRIDATEAEEYRFMNPLKKARPGSGQIRNLTEVQEVMAEKVAAPLHLRKRTPFAHPYPEMNTKKSRMFDPYDYFRSNLLEQEEKTFNDKE